MKQLNPLEKLDFILSRVTTQRPYNQLYLEIEPEMLGRFGAGEFDLILDKLREDGYIDFVVHQKILTEIRASDGIEIRRNFDGTVFINSGGYVTQDKINENDLKVKDDRDKLLVRGTWWLVAGAFALVIWEMVKYFYYEGHSLCH